MLRSVLILALCGCIVPSVLAAPSPEPPAVERKVVGKENKRPDQFVLNEQTEVRLNGATCSYADVPDEATIVRLEVAPDRRTIVRIEFRSAK